MGNTVFIIDDDIAVRDALSLLLGLRGYRTMMFSNAADFLDAYRPDWRGCLLIDIRMPGMDGLALQQKILDMGCRMPVIIITGHGDVASAREAFRANAVDFLEKPLDKVRLIEAIDDALSRQESVSATTESQARLAKQIDDLTPREREVMAFVVAGQHNRDIAERLGISVRTVEVHKSRMMAKLHADSVAELVRLSLGIAPPRNL